jgi:hypothetical protein
MQSLQSTKTPFFPELDRIGWEVVPNSETEYDKNYEWYNIQFKSDYWGLEHYGIPLEKFTLFRCDIDRDLLDCISSVYVIAECGNGVIEYLFDPYHEYDFAMAILDTESGLYKEFESNMSYEKALYEKKASMYGWCVYYPNLNDFLEDTPYFPSSKLCCSLDKLKVYGSSKYIPRYVINEYKISLDEWRHIEEPPEPNLWLELTFLFNTYKLYYCEKENNKVECKVTCNGELRATWKWEKGKHGLAKKFFEYVGFSRQDHKHP